jgi:hypothetical protein
MTPLGISRSVLLGICFLIFPAAAPAQQEVSPCTLSDPANQDKYNDQRVSTTGTIWLYTEGDDKDEGAYSQFRVIDKPDGDCRVRVYARHGHLGLRDGLRVRVLGKYVEGGFGIHHIEVESVTKVE